jgi:hypothetical protein
LHFVASDPAFLLKRKWPENLENQIFKEQSKCVFIKGAGAARFEEPKRSSRDAKP